MLRVSLSQLISYPRKFIAIVLAVIIATLFLSSTLIADDSLQATLRASIGQSYGKSDLIVSINDATDNDQKSGKKPSTLSPADVETIARLPFVENVYALYYVPAVLMTTADDGFLSVQFMSTPPSNMSTFQMLEGEMPTDTDHIAITTQVRDRLEIGHNETVKVLETNSIPSSTSKVGHNAPSPRNIKVSGIIDSSATPELSLTPIVLADASLLTAIDKANGKTPARIQLKLLPKTKVAEAKNQIAAALATKNIAVNTVSDQVSSDLESSLGGARLVTTFLLVFALISLFVAVIVIYNTFSVLITGRMRELALLRCIGAYRQQVRNCVLIESLTLGFVAALIGVLAAITSMMGVINFAKNFPATSLAAFSIPPSAIIIGLLSGTIITMVAALIPAIRTTRIVPLAALAPEDKTVMNTRQGKGLLVAGVILILVGTCLTVWASTTEDLRSYQRLTLAAIGGILSFSGLLMCSRLFMPRIIQSIGLITKPCGAAGDLASLNAIRNPRRTSTSAAALLIGVTLVTLMLTGAQGSRESMDEYLNNRYPIDIVISGPNALQETLDKGMAENIEESVDTVRAALLVPVVGKYNTIPAVTAAEAPGDSSGQGPAPDPESYAYAITPEDARRILQEQNIDYGDNDIFLPPKANTQEKIKLTGTSGSIALDRVDGSSENLPALITPAAARKIGGSNPRLTEIPKSSKKKNNSWISNIGKTSRNLEPEIWISYSDGLNEKEKIKTDKEIMRLLKVQEHQILGVTAQKELFNTFIDVILAIVTALLAVAVLIALIGMANTLSLSVLERTRENSLLRALGLTKNQLRGMLTIESLLIAFAASFVGIILGTVYGNLAIDAIFGNHASNKLIVAWLPVMIVLLTALISGLLSSLLPARRATNLPPVQGLAVD